MYALKVSTAVALVWLTAFAVPVSAQSFDVQSVHCANQTGQITPAVRIAACTALLASGRFDVQNLSHIHNFRGGAYRALGDIARAIADFDEAIRLNPQSAHAYNNRGNAYSAQGDLARAIADYSEAIRLNPQLAIAYSNRGVAYHGQGDLVRAITDQDSAIRLNPQDSVAYYNRGLVHEQLGDVARAAADFAEYARLEGR